MNRIGVQTSGPAERLGIAETYRRVREWGFDAVDVNINDMLTKPMIQEDRIPEVYLRGGRDFLELFRPFAEASEATGIANGQAHAPIPSMVHPADGPVNGRIMTVLQNVAFPHRGLSVRLVSRTERERVMALHPFGE